MVELGDLYEWQYEYIDKEVEPDVFERVIHENRTYSSTVCEESCQEERVVESLLERIQQVTGIPPQNAQDFELRRYEQGQEKLLEHDYEEFELKRPQGVRIATVHVFLSEADTDEGGAIRIPSLDATVLPKKGRAVIWSNVLSEDPDAMDPRMQYSIEAPTQGTQYSATVYLHQRDYKTAQLWACHREQKDPTHNM